MRAVLVLVAMTCFGCVDEPIEELDADVGEEPVLEGEYRDKFTGVMTVVGDLPFNTVKTVNHKAGKWSAFKLTATAGPIVVDVWSENADPVLWLVDKSNEILAYNDDDGRSSNAHIEYSLRTDDTIYVVMRDYNKRSAIFHARATCPRLGPCVELVLGQ